MADKTTYKSIAKANALFGGVQIFNIIIAFARSKIVAVLLGPSGMGLLGLFQSTLQLIRSTTSMGIQTSAVRDVSIAYQSNNDNEIGSVKTMVSRIVWITGMFGTLITFIGANYLSYITFGNYDFITHFRILAIILLIWQLTVQHNVLLQGLRKLRKLAFANIWGSLVGLFINVPIFFFFREDGIVPSLIITALCLYIVAKYNSDSLGVKKVRMTWIDTFKKSYIMIQMGFMIGLTGMMDMVTSYVLKVVIQNWGSIVEVGLYTAGFSMVQQYVNIVFSSISTDYYPRLCASANNKSDYSDVINKQFEILILILLPLVLLLISLSKPILYILYSSEFTSIYGMVNWLALGMLLRAHNWCPGYLYLAKGDSRLYFIIYIVTFIFELSVYLSCYYIWGLIGMGIGFVINNVASSIATVIITKIKYGYSYTFQNNKLMTYVMIFSVIVLILSFVLLDIYSYIINIFILIIGCCYSYHELNKRLDIMSIIRSRIIKKEYE